jgi:hypothetical protein
MIASISRTKFSTSIDMAQAERAVAETKTTRVRMKVCGAQRSRLCARVAEKSAFVS